MGTFKSILFVADLETRKRTPFNRVLKLATAHGARLTIVSVLKRVPPDAKKLLREVISPDELEELVVSRRVEKLEHLAETARKKGLKADFKVLEGRPFVEVIREVLRENHDLVVKTVEEQPDGRKAFFQSSDLRLLRNCPSPVWMMKVGSERKYHRILAAVDPNPEEPEQLELSQLTLALALQMAEAESCDLHVVHAWQLPAEEFLREGYARPSKREVDYLVSKQKEFHGRYLDDLLARFDVSNAHRHLIKGAASDVIPAIAQKARAELVVMGTVARTGIRGFFIGNTAETVLQRVRCSVLALKPPGFVSPISAK